MVIYPDPDEIYTKRTIPNHENKKDRLPKTNNYCFVFLKNLSQVHVQLNNMMYSCVRNQMRGFGIDIGALKVKESCSKHIHYQI